MPLFLELNDLGIRCYHQGELLFQSPGVAIVDKPMLFGTDAWHASRKKPLNTHCQFWSQLNTDPIHSHHPQVRHNGDLAYWHLQHIESQLPFNFADQEVIFSLPGSTPRESLGLLLGIAQQCGMNTVGLVDSALASMIGHVKDQKQWHLEMHLNHCVLTELTLSDNRLQRTNVETISDQGWLDLHNQLLRYFSELFIQQTRFNPRHGADSEQSLFDAIPLWLQESVNTDTLECELEGYSIQLDTKALRQFVQNFMHPLHQQLRHTPNLYLGDRLAQWAAILIHPINASPVTERETASALLTISQQLASSPEGVRFISSLPCEAVTPVTETRPTASHLLWKHHAYPLHGHYSLSLQGDMVRGEHAQALLTLKNGVIEADTVHADRLTLNGSAWQLDTTAQAEYPFLCGDSLRVNDLKADLVFIRVER